MTTFLIVAAAFALLMILVTAVDCNRFVIREYTCISDKLGREGKFILLSDLHNKSFGEKNIRLLRAIDEQKPDAVLIAGDMYTSSSSADNAGAAGFVSCLAGKYPVYYGMGNHEHKTRLYPEDFGSMYEDYMRRVEKAGTRLLINQRVSLPVYNIELFGLEIDQTYYQKLAKPSMEKSYLDKLLIAHNPDYFETYADWGADLTVSGDVHGGLMRLPVFGGVISPRLRLFPRYDGGRFERDKKVMILGRGLGSHTLPIRIFNPGELVVIHLKKR